MEDMSCLPWLPVMRLLRVGHAFTDLLDDARARWCSGYETETVTLHCEQPAKAFFVRAHHLGNQWRHIMFKIYRNANEIAWSELYACSGT